MHFLLLFIQLTYRAAKAPPSVVLSLILFVPMGVLTPSASASTSVSGTISFGDAADQLSWMEALISRLDKTQRLRCSRKRACPSAGASCRQSSNKQASVVIDAVLPGGGSNRWYVAYRLTCSECYLGGKGYLLLVEAGRGEKVNIIDKIQLRGGGKNIPEPIEISSEDFDEDGGPEVICRYRHSVEKKGKCTGMRESDSYLLVARAKGQTLQTVYHEQLSKAVSDNGHAFSTAYRFEDESEDGYSDLILTRTVSNKYPRKGGPMTTHSVHRYVEENGDWSAKAYKGYALGSHPTANCSVPLPEKPYVVVASMVTGDRITADMEKKADALRQAGFERTCAYRGREFDGLSDSHCMIIVSAHGTLEEANEAVRTVRSRGFTPFVKEIFIN